MIGNLLRTVAIGATLASNAFATSIAFDDHVEHAAGPYPFNLAFADFDGDGAIDAAAANPDAATDPLEISVLLNQGAGTFGARSPVFVGEIPHSIAAGDLDGDGDADIVVGYQIGSFRAGIVLNDGDAGFGAAQPLAELAGRTDAIAAIDLDVDGDRDILIGQTAGVDEIVVLENLGGGAFAEPVGFGGPSSAYFLHLAIGNVDGDDDPDVAIGRSLAQDNASIYRNQGDGSFVRNDIEGLSSSFAGNALGDVDGDGDLDLAMVSGSAQVLLLKNAGGIFTSWGTFPAGAETTTGSDLNLADLDGDGRADAMIPGTNTFRIATLRSAGAAGFEAATFHEIGWVGRCVSAVDLDGDQDLDVAVALPQADEISVLLNQATTSTGVEIAAPGGVAFGPAHPNPFRASTTIPVVLDAPGRAQIRVLDVSGRRVRSLFDGEIGAARALSWDARDDSGAAVAPGLYFVELQSAGAHRSIRVVVAE